MRAAPFLVLALLPSMLHAQAAPGCNEHPQTLAQMRGCFRPLLVFAPAPDNAQLVAQTRELDAAADDMMDRFVILVPVTSAPARWSAPLDAPYAVLPVAELARIREHFHVPPGEFRTILLGEDGSAKMQSSRPIPTSRLNGLIDTMPTRKVEMQRPHSN
jgi:hypothetical protein